MRAAATTLAFPVVFVVAVATGTGQDLRLVTAAADQDTQTVQALLVEGVDVNTPRADGATALLWATHWGAFDTVDAVTARRRGRERRRRPWRDAVGTRG